VDLLPPPKVDDGLDIPDDTLVEEPLLLLEVEEELPY
jgi:hypothetical protein